MHAERVDGYNPLAVIDAYKRKKDVAKKDGPVLLEIVTYRISGHSPSDSSSYRTKEEIALWEAEDSIREYGRQLIEAGVCGQSDLDAIWDAVRSDMLRNMKLGVDETVSPRLDVFGKECNAIGDLMFSNQKIRSMDPDRKAEVLLPYEEGPRGHRVQKERAPGRRCGRKAGFQKQGFPDAGRFGGAHFEKIL